MVALLSQGWLDLLGALGAELPERPGASARVRHVVSGAPGGEVAYVEVFQDGRVTSATSGPGGDADADVTIALTYPDAVAIAAGQLDLHVAYMRGRVKVIGDMGALMAVLPVTQSDEHRAVLARLAEQTDR